MTRGCLKTRSHDPATLGSEDARRDDPINARRIGRRVGQGYSHPVSDALLHAFPSRLRDSVSNAVAMIPPAEHDAAGGFVVRVGDESVVIPQRIYNPEPLANVTDAWHGLERELVGCLYTRHHDGHVRERHLRSVIQLGYPWVVPFVVQLIGEYVVERSSSTSRRGWWISTSAVRLDRPCRAQPLRDKRFGAPAPYVGSMDAGGRRNRSGYLSLLGWRRAVGVHKAPGRTPSVAVSPPAWGLEKSRHQPPATGQTRDLARPSGRRRGRSFTSCLQERGFGCSYGEHGERVRADALGVSLQMDHSNEGR